MNSLWRHSKIKSITVILSNLLFLIYVTQILNSSGFKTNISDETFRLHLKPQKVSRFSKLRIYLDHKPFLWNIMCIISCSFSLNILTSYCNISVWRRWGLLLLLSYKLDGKNILTSTIPQQSFFWSYYLS